MLQNNYGIPFKRVFIFSSRCPSEHLEQRVSSAISVGLAGNYYMNGGTNSSVGIKASLDIIMGGVGFLGPIGFGLSATYFLLDAVGAFGGYGDPLLTPKR